MKVWVVLPALNEAENLPEMFEATASTLSALGGGYTMFVLDDGSRDRTAAVASDAARRLPVQVVSHGHTRGLARVMETALRWVLSRAGDQDVIVTMDADNTHPADRLPAMVGAIQGGADVVIASRYAPGGVEEGVPPSRRILSRGIGALLRLRFRLPWVRDYTSGYRAYRARLLQTAAVRYGTTPPLPSPHRRGAGAPAVRPEARREQDGGAADGAGVSGAALLPPARAARGERRRSMTVPQALDHIGAANVFWAFAGGAAALARWDGER